MKNFGTLIALLLVAFYCSISSVESLNCVTCTSCTQPWSNSTNPIGACTTGLDACLKTSIAYPGGGIVMKGCVPKSSCSDQELMIAGYGYSMTCCSTDGCNSAGLIQIKYFALLASVLISVFFMFKN